MKRLKELREQIDKHRGYPNDNGNYVCLGGGSRYVTFNYWYGIPNNEIYINDCYGWRCLGGTVDSALNYVTKEFYNNHIKDHKSLWQKLLIKIKVR